MPSLQEMAEPKQASGASAQLPQQRRPARMPACAQRGRAVANAGPLLAAAAARQPLHPWLSQAAAAPTPTMPLPGWLLLQQAARGPEFHVCRGPSDLQQLLLRQAASCAVQSGREPDEQQHQQPLPEEVREQHGAALGRGLLAAEQPGEMERRFGTDLAMAEARLRSCTELMADVQAEGRQPDKRLASLVTKLGAYCEHLRQQQQQQEPVQQEPAQQEPALTLSQVFARLLVSCKAGLLAVQCRVLKSPPLSSAVELHVGFDCLLPYCLCVQSAALPEPKPPPVVGGQQPPSATEVLEEVMALPSARLKEGLQSALLLERGHLVALAEPLAQAGAAAAAAFAAGQRRRGGLPTLPPRHGRGSKPRQPAVRKAGDSSAAAEPSQKQPQKQQAGLSRLGRSSSSSPEGPAVAPAAVTPARKRARKEVGPDGGAVDCNKRGPSVKAASLKTLAGRADIASFHLAVLPMLAPWARAGAQRPAARPAP